MLFLGLGIGFVAGANFGVIVMALFAANKPRR